MRHQFVQKMETQSKHIQPLQMNAIIFEHGRA